MEDKYKPPLWQISLPLAKNLIDPETMVASNPLNMFYPANAAEIYNVYSYCGNYFLKSLDIGSSSCVVNNPNLRPNTLVNFPASIYGAEIGISGLDRVKQQEEYQKLSPTIKNKYIYSACNISTLLFSTFRKSTSFHDNFVVSYLNLYQEPTLKHTFTVGNWLDLSYAQFGSGAITFILEKVRAINQMRRDGMWYFGDVNYIEENIEYSSWAIKQGFPYSYIWSVEEAGALLKALADRSETGVGFRKGIAASATTYIGDGVNYKNGVGDIGDRAFTIENSFAKYFCDGVYLSLIHISEPTRPY